MKTGRPIALIGRKYGRLTVLERVEIGKCSGMSKFKCRCDCGVEKVTTSKALRGGTTKSCGCLAAEHLAAMRKLKSCTAERKELEKVARRVVSAECRAEKSKIAKTRHPLWAIYRGMISRCYREKNDNYSLYGGRGITVCDRWRADFYNFVSDMGDRPSLGHSIDREDSNGNYEPSNVRWATTLEQVRNIRGVNTVYTLVWNGKERLISEVCKHLGVSPERVKLDIRKGDTPLFAVIHAILRKKEFTANGGKGGLPDYKRCRADAEIKYKNVQNSRKGVNQLTLNFYSPKFP